MGLMNHQQSEREAQRAQEGRDELAERVARAVREDGSVDAPGGLSLLRWSSPTPKDHGISSPAFCLIAQGSKEVWLGDDRYRYDADHYLITAAALPTATRVTEASEERPYLGVVLGLDPSLVGSVMVEASHPAPREQAAVRAFDVSPPEGLQRLAFPSPLPFDPRELRRLSVASDPQRTLIGVRQDGEGGLRIWGLVNSGTRWLRDVQGGRRAGAPLPPSPVVHVGAPGSMEAYKGHEPSANFRKEGSLGRGWIPSSRNGCRANSLCSWRSSRSCMRLPGTARASSRARGGRRWSLRFRTGSRGA